MSPLNVIRASYLFIRTPIHHIASALRSDADYYAHFPVNSEFGQSPVQTGIRIPEVTESRYNSGF
jgi:hypothetical protein